MARNSRAAASRDESRYRLRTHGGASYRTQRVAYEDLAVIIKRFPPRDGAPTNHRPIVLVHGIGMSSRYFHPVAAELAKLCTVYVVDLPGYGSAPNPHRDVTLVDHAGVLARYLREAGIVNPVLVGHSMGTQVVTQLAVDHPGVSDRLVLIAPTMDARARTLARAGLRLLIDTTREPLAANGVVLTDYLFRCGIRYYLRQLPHLLGDAIEERLPRIGAKTLVMRGDGDRVSPDGWSHTVAGLLPHGSHMAVHGPHVVMFTDPERVATLIVEHAAS